MLNLKIGDRVCFVGYSDYEPNYIVVDQTGPSDLSGRLGPSGPSGPSGQDRYTGTVLNQQDDRVLLDIPALRHRSRPYHIWCGLSEIVVGRSDTQNRVSYDRLFKFTEQGAT